jgi:protein-S-isoprenylcysteine O-methyltransferase Ste14
MVLLVLGGLLVRGAEAAMKRVGTDPRPSHPSTAIVTSGPFRFTRNPMYVGPPACTRG